MNIIEITPQSMTDLKEVLAEQGITENSLRINVNIGWGGASFYIALDEPKEDDVVCEVEDLKFIVSNRIQQIYQGFSIESVKSGHRTMFRILPKVQDNLGGGCASCTSC